MQTLKIEIPKGFKVESFDEKTGTVKFTEIPKDIKDRVKSIGDACEVLGNQDPDVIACHTLFNAGVETHILANQELVVITKALNEGWTPDWHNGSFMQ
ncbi:hypothetical protein [Chryseobacterium sp.]|uniref:hypothetical protein n=1 Tax=Chryseobacterium sp. TaxID=1871047 RepID=UPI002FCA60AA